MEALGGSATLLAFAFIVWLLVPKSDRKAVTTNISATIVDATGTARKSVQYANEELDHARSVGQMEKVGEYKKAKADAGISAEDIADYEALIASLNK